MRYKKHPTLEACQESGKVIRQTVSLSEKKANGQTGYQAVRKANRQLDRVSACQKMQANSQAGSQPARKEEAVSQTYSQPFKKTVKRSDKPSACQESGQIVGQIVSPSGKQANVSDMLSAC